MAILLIDRYFFSEPYNPSADLLSSIVTKVQISTGTVKDSLKSLGCLSTLKILKKENSNYSKILENTRRTFLGYHLKKMNHLGLMSIKAFLKCKIFPKKDIEKIFSKKNETVRAVNDPNSLSPTLKYIS